MQKDTMVALDELVESVKSLIDHESFTTRLPDGTKLVDIGCCATSVCCNGLIYAWVARIGEPHDPALRAARLSTYTMSYEPIYRVEE